MGTFRLTQEANALVGDEVGEVVDMVVVFVFDTLSVAVEAVVVESTVANQTLPFCPARRNVRPRILVQVFAKVACRANAHAIIYAIN